MTHWPRAEVVLSGTLEDGRVLVMQDPMMILVGTRQRSWAHDEAIRIVRTGLADTCRWLGIPEREPTHEDILRGLSRRVGLSCTTLRSMLLT